MTVTTVEPGPVTPTPIGQAAARPGTSAPPPAPPAPPPAGITDLLLNLAGAAQLWQRTLLDAHGALAGQPAPDAAADQVQVVLGRPAIEVMLRRLLGGANRVSVWLHPGVPDPGAADPGLPDLAATNATTGERVDLLALAAGQPGLHLRALLDGARIGPLPAGPRPAVELRVTATRSPAGGQYDTMVVDGTALAILASDADGQLMTVVVAQPVLADVVQSFFDSLWTSAVPAAHVLRMRSVLGGRVKREILRRLADGDKDEAIARGLGISLRTCRRYIAEIIAAVGAVSRFQAGFLLAYDQPAYLTEPEATT